MGESKYRPIPSFRNEIVEFEKRFCFCKNGVFESSFKFGRDKTIIDPSRVTSIKITFWSHKKGHCNTFTRVIRSWKGKLESTERSFAAVGEFLLKLEN